MKFDMVIWIAYNLLRFYLQWERRMDKVYTRKDIVQVRVKWIYKVCCQVSRQLELIDQYLGLYFVDNLWKIKLLALDFCCMDIGIIDVTFSY